MGDWDYTYDTMNRLGTAISSLPYSGWEDSQGAQITGTGRQYSYDPYGNRISEAAYGSGKTCFNRSWSYGGNRMNGYAYDAAGNVTGDGTYTYAYDAEGRLGSVSGGGYSASYLYDPEGQRVQSTINGATSTFGRNPNGSLAWTNFLSGTAQEVYFNGRHFGSVFANSDKTLNHVVYSQVDAVGTERGQFDKSQNRLATFTSNPYGDNQAVWGANSGTLHFTGKERDTESGNDYFGARYYSSSMGRFLSPDYSDSADDLDPVPYADLTNPQSLNLYSYVKNNPLSQVDKDGHCPQCALVLETTELGAEIGSVGGPVGTLIGAGVGAIAGAGAGYFGGQAISNLFHSSAPAATAQPGQKDADFVVTPAGTAVSTDPGRVRDSLVNAPGVKTDPVTGPSGETGTIQTGVQTPNGPVDVRTMDGSSSHGPRTVITHPSTNSPKSPDGKATNNKDDNHIPSDHKRPGRATPKQDHGHGSADPNPTQNQ